MHPEVISCRKKEVLGTAGIGIPGHTVMTSREYGVDGQNYRENASTYKGGKYPSGGQHTEYCVVTYRRRECIKC